VGGLPYFGFVVGELIAFVAVVLINEYFVKKLMFNNNIPGPA
jgi:MFS transporter, DHA1 family, multidrug resistance protein